MHVTLWRREANQKMCCLWTALCPQSRRLGLDYSCSLFPSTLTNLILDSCPQEKYVVKGQKETELLEPHPSGARKKCPPYSPPSAPTAPSRSNSGRSYMCSRDGSRTSFCWLSTRLNSLQPEQHHGLTCIDPASICQVPSILPGLRKVLGDYKRNQWFDSALVF